MFSQSNTTPFKILYVHPSLSSSLLKTQSRNSISLGKRIINHPPNPRRSYSTIFGYQQAKALVYPAFPRVLDLHTHSISPPHSSLVTLRTLCAPINPADINQIQGTYASKPDYTKSLSTPTPVAIPGNEACLEVVATGSSVTSVKPGDWVIARTTGLGTWRTHLQVDESAVVRVDKEGLTAAQVATVSINPVTAWRLLKDIVELQEGDWFVLNGANSGVGRAAIQFGKLWGLKSIAIIRAETADQEPNLMSELEALGATKVVRDNTVHENSFPAQVIEWSVKGPGKVRLGLNCVGGSLATKMGNVLSRGAHMVTYGSMSKAAWSMAARRLIFDDLKYTGFWVSRWADEHPEEKKKTVEQILTLIREGVFKDPPFVEIPWNWDTPKTELVEATAEKWTGVGRGKRLFVFGD